MTKVYVVHCHERKDNVSYVSEVFTNKRLANNYAKWIQDIRGNKNIFYYITEHKICKFDYKLVSLKNK